MCVAEANEIEVKLIWAIQLLWATQRDAEKRKLIRLTVRFQVASREADGVRDRQPWLVPGIPQTNILQFRLWRAPAYSEMRAYDRDQFEVTGRGRLAVGRSGKA